MTTRQMALIHHAAAIPVDGEQWRLRMEMWMEASRPEPLSEIIRGLDDMRIDYDLSRCVQSQTKMMITRISNSSQMKTEADNFCGPGGTRMTFQCPSLR
jgi:allophanate hydrolase subunit 1